MKATILILFFFLNSIVFGQETDKWLSVDYRTKHSHESMKINRISDYTFFLHGEIHTVSSSPQTKLEFLKYYYKEANVRNLVIEAGYGSAYLLNLYLSTGDESYICKDYNFFSHKEYREFWRELYEFNNTLIDPLHVVGIDDHETRLVWFKAIEVLFKDKAYQHNNNNNNIDHLVISQIITIIQSIDDLSDFDHINRNDMDYLKKEFVLNYKNNTNSYSEILQKDSLHLRLIIQNDVSTGRTRFTNKYMYDNLHELIKAKQVNSGNYFGQFGSAHVENHNRSLTRFLNDLDESHFFGKVLTILPLYFNCRLSDLNLEGKGVNTIIYPIKYKKKNTSLSSSTYILEELKNKKNKPNKYTLHVKNKDAMRFDFPEVCD